MLFLAFLCLGFTCLAPYLVELGKRHGMNLQKRQLLLWHAPSVRHPVLFAILLGGVLGGERADLLSDSTKTNLPRSGSAAEYRKLDSPFRPGAGQPGYSYGSIQKIWI